MCPQERHHPGPDSCTTWGTLSQDVTNPVKESPLSFTGEGDWTQLLIFYSCYLSTLFWCPEQHRRALYQAQLLFGPHDYYSRGRTVPEKDFFLLFPVILTSNLPISLPRGGNCTNANTWCSWVWFVICNLVLGDCNKLGVAAECPCPDIFTIFRAEDT